MSTTAAVATHPPAVTTPPPRPPPPTALPKQQPDPSCTTDQSNGGRDSPVKETKFRPIRSKTITGRPRSGEVTSSRPEHPPPLSARHRSYSTSSRPPPRKQPSISPPFRPSPSPSSPSPSSPSPSSPSTSSPSSSSPSHKPDRPPPPKKPMMQRPSRPPPLSQTSKTTSLPRGFSSAAAMESGSHEKNNGNTHRLKENSPSGSSPSHQPLTTTSAPTSPLTDGNIVNGVTSGVLEGAGKLLSDLVEVDGGSGVNNGSLDERQTPTPEKPPRRTKKGNQQQQQQQQQQHQSHSTKPDDAVTNGDARKQHVVDLPVSTVENHSPVTNGSTKLSPPVIKDSPSKTTADKPAIPRRPYQPPRQPPRPFPPPRNKPQSHVHSHDRHPESHDQQPESHDQQLESHKSKVEENKTHISNGIQPPQTSQVAQKNGASEVVDSSVKSEGETKERGPHESGGQATHTRTLYAMGESETSEMSSPSRGRKILNSMKKSFRSLRQRKRDSSRKDSELKRSCSDTALAQVEEEEEEGETVRRKEEPRRYPDPLPQGIISPLVVQCVAYINRDSVLREQGLFRIPGDVATIKRLRSDFVRGFYIDLSKVLDPHTVTGLLKVHFREQRVSLIPRGQPLAEIVQGVKSRNVQAVKSVLDKIFISHTATLRVITEMFAKIVEYSEYNQMTSGTLATSCGPSIFPYVSPNNANAILKFLVDHYDEIFTNE